MNKNRTADYQDTRVDVKVVLAGLWTSMLFVFAYVDIFGFWRAGVSTSRKDEYIGKVDTALLSAPQ